MQSCLSLSFRGKFFFGSLLVWTLIMPAWGGLPLGKLVRPLEKLLNQQVTSPARPIAATKQSAASTGELHIEFSKLLPIDSDDLDRRSDVFRKLTTKEDLENYLAFWKVLQKDSPSKSPEDPYRTLASRFRILALSPEQDFIPKELYRWVAGGLHPAFVPMLIKSAENASSEDELETALLQQMKYLSGFLDFRIVQSESGPLVPVSENRVWGPLEGLQVAFMSFRDTKYYALGTLIANYHGWDYHELSQLAHLLRKDLSSTTSPYPVPGTIEEVIGIYKDALQSMEIPFKLRKTITNFARQFITRLGCRQS